MSKFDISAYEKKSEKLAIVEVEAPSGFVFTVKTMSMNESLKITKSLGVYNQAQVKHQDVEFEKESEDVNSIINVFEMTEKLLLKNIIVPRLSKTRKKGFLFIDDIDQEDYRFLVAVMKDRSFATNEKKKNLLPSDEKCNPAGCDCKEVQNNASRTA